MRHTEPDQPGYPIDSEASPEQERLLRENQDLKRQLQELKSLGNGAPHSGQSPKVWHPSAITIWVIFLVVTVVVVVAFFSGYLPLQKRRELIASEAHDQERALPKVEVMEVG